jgi:hypothetical protein
MNTVWMSDGGDPSSLGRTVSNAFRRPLRSDSRNTGAIAPPGITPTGPAKANASFFPLISTPSNFFPNLPTALHPFDDALWPASEYFAGLWPMIRSSSSLRCPFALPLCSVPLPDRWLFLFLPRPIRCLLTDPD